MVNVFKNLSQKLKRTKTSTVESSEYESTQSRPQTAHPTTTQGRPSTAYSHSNRNRHVTWELPQNRESLTRELRDAGYKLEYVSAVSDRLAYTQPPATTRSSQSVRVRQDKPLPPLPPLRNKPESSSRSGNSSTNSVETYPDFEEVLAAQRNRKRWTKELLNDGEWASDTLEHAGISTAFPGSSASRPVPPAPVRRTTGLQRSKAQRVPSEDRKQESGEESSKAIADFDSERKGWI
jgi:hypothetical protein